MKPIAIRSLQCVDHAQHIPPRVMTVLWFLGKRCNYDCSYCSPHVHDAVSPFVDQHSAMRFADHMCEHMLQADRKIKWSFTGGEPFLDPGMMLLAKHLRQQTCTEQINVVTNGSLPLEVYRHAGKIFDGITFSLHLERSPEEIHSIVDKISEIQECMTSVNLMFLPGRLDLVQDISARLQQHGINHVVRKILPPVLDPDLVPYTAKSDQRKAQILDDMTQQVSKKIMWKKYNLGTSHTQQIDHYYSLQERNYLENSNQNVGWNNCGVWFEDGSYQELNTDFLVANDLNRFQGWQCYAGVDSLYVDFDGSIYRGMCQNAGAIGHIADVFDLGKIVPTRCQLAQCTCNSDIAVRKSRTGHSPVDVLSN